MEQDFSLRIDIIEIDEKDVSALVTDQAEAVILLDQQGHRPVDRLGKLFFDTVIDKIVQDDLIIPCPVDQKIGFVHKFGDRDHLFMDMPRDQDIVAQIIDIEVLFKRRESNEVIVLGNGDGGDVLAVDGDDLQQFAVFGGVEVYLAIRTADDQDLLIIAKNRTLDPTLGPGENCMFFITSFKLVVFKDDPGIFVFDSGQMPFSICRS